jgi:hypothetical protein|uniref:Peptidase S54 rhomboid domain-containing protein n=1 Tax=uncultured bacterium contig00106 TaxID=1181572 RepID=A0A806K301_9BACT|nr:hypothetical protein [uncultured bacterium contig00106]
MRQINFPNWLVWIDGNLKWLSIPKLPLLLTIIQAAGFFLVMSKPAFQKSLILDPNKVLNGEFWLVFTFIAIPVVNSFFVFFVLWFFYDVMRWLEDLWGSTLLTVYFLFAWFSTVFASLVMGIPIVTFVYMEFSFFFALATLTPNREIHLFFILPIAFKWIAAFIAIVLLVVPLLLGSVSQQIYIILLFANYLIFFGKDYWLRFKNELERRR